MTGETVATGETALGRRLRALREAKGLSQAELAGGRFSKEYVSQIELGKTRPTHESLRWLAEQLGVDLELLETGVAAAERQRVESALAEAELLSEEDAQAEALSLLEGVRASPAAALLPRLRLRLLLAESWALTQSGRPEPASALLRQAEELVDGGSFADLDRAEVAFRLGVARYVEAETGEAIALFGRALDLAARSGAPSDRFRATVHGWRSRCYRRERDWVAAREDVERAVELAEAAGDRRAIADACSLALLVAEREGRWPLARAYGERAIALYRELDDRRQVARMLNDLAGVNLLLGHTDDAVARFTEAAAAALAEGSEGNAALAIVSRAQARLRAGDAPGAAADARRSLELFGGRADYLQQIGIAQLTLGQALLRQHHPNEAEEALRAADETFTQLSSTSHRAAAWVALGDLADARGDPAAAARLYRRAAEALQQQPTL